MGCVSTVSYFVLVNGFPSTPLAAKKGLRQGDPMSPFLFSICMEYLSKCLKEMIENLDFNFHPRCSKLDFQKFSCAFGLAANLDKSDVYFGEISEQVQDDLQSMLGVAKGFFPFRYLGVPLSSKKLTISLCRPFIERAYWSQIFILRKKILREMDSRFRFFLWTGKGNPSKKALVSWKYLCLPKTCGDWNLTSLDDWNKVAVTKVLLDIAHKSDNLLVKWVHIYYFKNRDFWSALIPKK
ncbi:uncharacterized protein LOC110705904 [Chenopodium quinoa]|uniref:uncharacterized protein LOC110705904 n=1 Tax=Chenopodium quinoa TaxID=63459 RepID=UPI000B76C27C|nr:uncharacterized protein LOC110705904 [Chenopodium quinoa]